jgi:hypothetical protein
MGASCSTDLSLLLNCEISTSPEEENEDFEEGKVIIVGVDSKDDDEFEEVPRTPGGVSENVELTLIRCVGSEPNA